MCCRLLSLAQPRLCPFKNRVGRLRKQAQCLRVSEQCLCSSEVEGIQGTCEMSSYRPISMAPFEHCAIWAFPGPLLVLPQHSSSSTARSGPFTINRTLGCCTGTHPLLPLRHAAVECCSTCAVGFGLTCRSLLCKTTSPGFLAGHQQNKECCWAPFP